MSGFAQILMTGEIADPTTDPRPVVKSVMCAPQEMSSTISALSEMLRNPNRGSPSGPPVGGSSPGLMIPQIFELPDLQ